MKNVLDYAMYFMQNGYDTNPNTYDGNMKLQKLLFFSNLISLVKNGEKLYDEPILAFENGCVIECVRCKYRYDYNNFKQQSEEKQFNFTKKEKDVLDITTNIFGDLSAQELSDLNHTFEFWKNALQLSKQSNGYYDKELAVINDEDLKKELYKIKIVLDNYEKSQKNKDKKEVINGKTFYYNPLEVCMNDKLIDELIDFSKEAEDDIYTIYYDNGELVIY